MSFDVNSLLPRALLQLYIPEIFIDEDGRIVPRTYMHVACRNSAPYGAFGISKNGEGVICPMCSSRENNVIPNKSLDKAILEFTQKFFLKDDTAVESCYNLAFHFFKEKNFENVIEICKRALGFVNIDTKVIENLRLLLLESQPSVQNHLQQIRSFEDKIKNCEEKIIQENDKTKKEELSLLLGLYHKCIADEKSKIAQIYVNNNIKQKAIDTFNEAITSYVRGLGLISTRRSSFKNLVFKRLAFCLDSFGDFLVVLKNLPDAIEEYQKSIETIKEAIGICKEELDVKKYSKDLDKSYLKLSNAYELLADQYNLENNEPLATEFYNRAKKVIEEIKNKESESIKRRRLDEISKKLSRVKINQEIDRLVKELEE